MSCARLDEPLHPPKEVYFWGKHLCLTLLLFFSLDDHFTVALDRFWEPIITRFHALVRQDMSQFLLLGKLGYGLGPIFKVVLEC